MAQRSARHLQMSSGDDLAWTEVQSDSDTSPSAAEWAGSLCHSPRDGHRWKQPSGAAEVRSAWQPAPGPAWHMDRQAGMLPVPCSLQLNLRTKYSLCLGWSLIYSTREQMYPGGHSKNYCGGPHKDIWH